MFDSFYVEDVEVQTKKLDSSLRSYHIGDAVPSYEGNFDGPTGSYYLIEDAYPSRRWYGLIIINNIFIDAIVSDYEEQTTRETKVAFDAYIALPHLRTLKFEDAIKSVAADRQKLKGKLNAISGACREYAEFKNPDGTKFRRLFSNYTDRFEAGETLEDLILSIIKPMPKEIDQLETDTTGLEFNEYDDKEDDERITINYLNKGE